MRISTLQMQDRGVNAILDSQSALSDTQQQLAAGRRVLSPSDDVFATTQALAMKRVIASHQQFQENLDVAEFRLKTEEINLDQMINVMQRVRELAVQGTNATYGAGERATIALEVRALLDELISIANSADADGDYIFAGLNVDTLPVGVTDLGGGLFDYTYDAANSGQRFIQIGVSSQISIGDPGDAVFFNVPESGGGTENLFETIEQLSLALETNVPANINLTDLTLALDHLGSFRSSSGARQNVVEGHRTLSEDIIFQSQKTLSEVQDLDFAEAVSRLNIQLVGLEAAQKSFTRIQDLSLFNFL